MMRDVFANPDRRVFWRMTPGWVVCCSLRIRAVHDLIFIIVVCACGFPADVAEVAVSLVGRVCIILHSLPRLLYHHLPLIPSSSVL